MADTARASTAGKGWRTPLGFLGSSIRLSPPSKPDPNLPTLSSHTTILHTPKLNPYYPTPSYDLPTIKRPWAGPQWPLPTLYCAGKLE